MSDHSKQSLKASLSQFHTMQQTRSHSLQELLQGIDEKGFGILLVLLSVPSALPVPAAGYSTPFGLAILALGIQMLKGRHAPSLPQKVQKLTLPRGIIGGATKFLGIFERFIRPRFRYICEPAGRRALALLVILMSLLMTLPVPGTNTFPAMVIFLVGVCLCEDDGLVGIVAFLAGVFAIAVYTAAIGFMIYFFQEYGLDGIDHFLHIVIDFVKELLGIETGPSEEVVSLANTLKIALA